MHYVDVPIPHEECNYYLLQTYINKKILVDYFDTQYEPL